MVLCIPRILALKLTAFSDADHVARCLIPKSTSGGIQFLVININVMPTQLQIMLPTTESKYRCTATLISHSNLMQPSTTFTGQMHNPYSVSLHKGTALPEDRFKYLVRRIGMRCLTPAELEVLTNESA
ncbi:hypothetical protein Tco_1215243 [Tanacetum coccineum]